MAAVFQPRRRLDGHQPALVGVEAADLEEEEPIRIAALRRLTQRAHGAGGDCVEEALGDAVRYGERVDAIVPQAVLHIAADSGDGGRKVQRTPVDAMQRHQAVTVPHQNAAVADVVPVQHIRGADHRLGGVPVFANDDDDLPLCHGRADDLVVDEIGDRLVVVVEFVLFAVIDPVGIMLAYPLTPTPQMQLPIHQVFRRRLVGVADKDQVGLVAHMR